MLILDGRKDSEFGLKALIEHEHPLNAEMEHKTLKIPGKDGLYYFGSEINAKPFLLTFDIVKDDSVHRQHKLNEFISFLYDAYGKPREIKAVFDYEPDVYYMIRIGELITPTRLNGLTQFELPFIAYNPYKYSVAYADEITWGSDVITFQSHYKLGHPGSDGLKVVTGITTLDVQIDGLAVKPIVEITGSATGLVLSVNGYSISLGSFASSSWSIDCEKYIVKKNGVDAFSTVSLRDFTLLPGNNKVSFVGSNMNFSIRVKSRDKYI